MKKAHKSPKEKMALVTAAEGTATSLAVLSSPLFRENSTGVSKGMKVKSRSPMLKPAQFPIGRILSGIFKRLIPCMAGQDKVGVLIEIVPDLNSVGVAIPATATLTGPLEITNTGSATEMAGARFTSPYIGHTVEIEKLEDKIPSKKGQDAWSFLVAISEEPATVE